MRITLCGSTRFESSFHAWSSALARAGHTVYSLSMFGREAADAGKDGKPIVSEEDKIILDLVHLDKILNSDAILVINPEDYVGFSTAREIAWAMMHRKSIYWHCAEGRHANARGGECATDLLKAPHALPRLGHG